MFRTQRPQSRWGTWRAYVTGAQPRWLQALAQQAGEDGAAECDTPYLNKQLLPTTEGGELGSLQSSWKSWDLEQRVRVDKQRGK